MQVEIWSDPVCPWCYLGKRRFERALESFDHRDEVTVVYRSFELDEGGLKRVRPLQVKEITSLTIPKDFEHKPSHRCWFIGCES